jgi:hypothetical protein
MKDSDVSIGVYKSKPATDFSPHIKRALVFILFTLVTRIIVRLAVMNLSRFMFEVSGSSELAEIFQQLKKAKRWKYSFWISIEKRTGFL